MDAGSVIVRRQLFRRLDQAGRVTEVSAPAGSGKTFLLRSWIGQPSMAGQAAWVPVRGGGRDPQQFWVAVADALRGTKTGAALVRPLTAAPGFDGWAAVERLLRDLAPIGTRIWLVVDDVHDLAPAEVLHQLELLILRAPKQLRFVLATRQERQLRLHRLRLEGELTEIRASDLRLTLNEARTLLEMAGAVLPETALAHLYARTEGWAAGLRMAAISVSGRPDPERFAAEFSGSERTVADYLLAEVLERQSEPVRRLLLRTSVLDRVCGELADLLTGEPGAERVLQDLEQAGAFVVSLDDRRSWFRYHHLFADLLRLELRRTAPAEVAGLHRVASRWLARHGFEVEAVRHAQAAGDWARAARLLSDHWVHLYLDGQAGTARDLLAAFPADLVATDAELTTLMAMGELNRGLPDEAERLLAHAVGAIEDNDEPVPVERRGRLQVLLSIVRLRLAQERIDLQAVAEAADQLLASAETGNSGPGGLGTDLRALAAITLGYAETWAWRAKEEADRRLEQGVALARQIGRPYLELTGLAYWARMATWRSLVVTEQRSRQAIELAERHGWGEDHAAAIAYTMLATALTGQGRPVEADPWLDRAGQTLRTEAHPAVSMNLHYARGLTEMARGRHADALADLQTGKRLAGSLVAPRALARPLRTLTLLAYAKLGDIDRAESVLADLDEAERHSRHMRIALASLRLAQQDPRAAVTALVPVLDRSVPRVEVQTSWLGVALLLEARARDALGQPDAAGHALERALQVTAPERALVPFLLEPLPALLKSHAQQTTAHADLIGDILGLLQQAQGEAAVSSPPSRNPGSTVPPATSSGARLREPLSQAEIRVLRYLPTHLSAPEIATELFVATSTVKTHMRNLYPKLGVHRRHEAVEQARALGLLAPASDQPEA